MAKESTGLTRRGSQTYAKLTQPGFTPDERIGAVVRVGAGAGILTVGIEEIAAHSGSAVATLASGAVPGLIGAAITVPIVAAASAIARAVEADHENKALRFPSIQYLYRDAAKASAVRTSSAAACRHVAAGGAVVSSASAIAAAGVALGPAVGISHLSGAEHPLVALAEVAAAVAAPAAVAARYWARRVGATTAPSLTE